ncbi:hypothetical protein ACFQ5D_13075 [Paenibacillus farraposensis]|uniref:Uncharacterized protein n=1 Tax=Paenibacillus farraposensis TaxID=2807095 RepID=A0ABW4DES5_9BACL|nr:hypothetical protein [Paenibacillus farraposensis]MCC3379336.1 hypothetical protein [Paenibacillus farraposensis]
MKTLWIFTFFMALMLGTILLVNLLFGVHHPWESISLAFHTMRPSEYIVLAGMLLLLFVTLGKKQIGHACQFIFSRWSRFLRVPSSNSASTHKSNQKEQKEQNI